MEKCFALMLSWRMDTVNVPFPCMSFQTSVIKDCLLADVAEKNFNLSKSQVHIAVIHILQLNVAHKFIV